MRGPVLPLDDPVAAEPSVSGGKGATLARLRSLGFPVPDGVVVTTATYRLLVDDSEIAERLAALDAAVARGDDEAQSAVAATLRDLIRERPLPTAAVDALERHLPDGPFAVRSSATAEDLPGASFAGQYDSFLGVEGGEAAATAVRDCMASLFTDRAVAYRARNDIATTDAAMAVVVQRFVEPDTSGILFTADPVSGDRSVSVAEAGPGRGDRQVSGRTTADSIRVGEDGTIIDYRVGPSRERPVLSDDDARALSAVGRRIADALGAPQDIEWAIRGGEISILQARQITALFPLPESEPADDGPRVYYSFGHRQGMPDAMPPLVLDGWTELIAALDEEFDLPYATATAGGRLYIDVTGYLRQPRFRDRLIENFESVDEPAAAALRTLLSDRPEDFPVTESSVVDYWRYGRLARQVWPFAWQMVGELPRAMFVENPAEAPEKVREKYDAAIAAAVDTIRSHDRAADRLDAAHGEIVDSVNWLLEPFYSRFLAALAAKALLRRLLPDQHDAIDSLALGIDHDVVYQMTSSLADVADVARETPAVVAALRDGATLSELRDREDAAAFLDAFDGFVAEYGFRGIGEIDWSRPRYREDPTPLLNVVASYLETTTAGAHRRRAEELTARAVAARATLVGASNPILRPLVRRLATVYREYIGLRELPKFALVQLFDEVRRQTLDAAADLVAADALPDESAVWLLSSDELRTALSDPRALIGVDFAARRREFERNERLTAPAVLTSDGKHPTPPTGTAAGRLFGTGAAPGVVEGVVRVITDPSETRLSSGEILVAPYTDPGWTPLFLNAAAVVTEVGGRLTHGSLVAREYGIPAVVAVEGATTRLRSGDRVRVDGTHGVVERLE